MMLMRTIGKCTSAVRDFLAKSGTISMLYKMLGHSNQWYCISVNILM